MEDVLIESEVFGSCRESYEQVIYCTCMCKTELSVQVSTKEVMCVHNVHFMKTIRLDTLALSSE